ncbi:MAG: hypothetical protein JWO92_632 [Chitinophagaceae bacterium]|nr:hypothetical protein [Chitinophagaceae bacterium]
MVSRYFKSAGLSWELSWQQKTFRYKLFVGIFILMIILISFPFFFQYIEKRKGLLLDDALLNWVAAYDVYILIFSLVWSCALFMLIAAVKDPGIFLTFLIAYILLSIVRMLSIFLFPLEPPAGIINLTDPLSNYFYGVSFITKDLFFSGHVSTLFLMYLCHHNKFMKYYTLISCLCVSILVLIQHIHYSIDVLFAFPFTYLCYSLAKYIALKRNRS